MENALANIEFASNGVVFLQTERTAVAAMELFRQFVRSLPLVAINDCQRDLRGLVAWYERVCVDESYAARPPVGGMHALLIAECERSASTAKGLVVARWAIRVAEEVVNLRSTLAWHQDEEALSVAQGRLELALQTALERLGTTA